MRAYAYARERVIIGIFTNSFFDSSVPSLLSSFSNVPLFFSVLPDLSKKQPIIFSKRPVTFNKTTRHFQQNNTSSMKFPTFIVQGTFQKKRTSNEIILLMPTTMVQDIPSIKAQKVVNSTITTTEHARMFPNVDSDSRFSDIAAW